jgi:antitoxin component of MazEF toxin-antitoxin module
MKAHETSLARIGNSRGIRLPAEWIRRHGLESGIVLEDRGDQIVVKALKPSNPKLSWEETAVEMSKADEDWSEWETAAGDGLEAVPWYSDSPTPKAVVVREEGGEESRRTKRRK